MKKVDIKELRRKSLSLYNSSVDGLFFAIGHIFTYWVNAALMTLGEMSKAALIVSTIWMSVHFMLHEYLATFISETILTALDELSLASMTVFPEIVVVSAIVITVTRWIKAIQARKFTQEYIWATLYSIPTLFFIVMTTMIFWHVSYDTSVQGFIASSDKTLMFIRICSSYTYFLVSILHLKMEDGKFIEDEMKKEHLPKVKVQKTKVVEVQKTFIPEISSASTFEEILPEKSEEKTSEEDQKILYIGSGRSTSLDNFLLEKTEEELSILSSKDGRREREEIAKTFGKSETTVRNRLKVLQEKKA